MIDHTVAHRINTNVTVLKQYFLRIETIHIIYEYIIDIKWGKYGNVFSLQIESVLLEIVQNKFIFTHDNSSRKQTYP